MGVPETVIVAGPLVFTNPADVDKGTVNVFLNFYLKNSGITPAISAWTDWLTYLSSKTSRDIFGNQRSECASARKRATATAIGNAIFPGQVFIDAPIAVPVDDKIGDRSKTPGLPDGIYIIIIGCINYEFTFERGRHQTGFVYWITQNDFTVIPVNEGDISKERLRISPMPGGGDAFYAD